MGPGERAESGVTHDDWTQPMMKTREYTLAKYAVSLRIKQERVPVGGTLDYSTERQRVGRVLQRWMARQLARSEPAAVISPLPAELRVDRWWEKRALLLGWTRGVRDVHPDDRETVQCWLGGGITSHYRLIVPVFEPIRLGYMS